MGKAGRVAVVTGATGSMGAAVARRLAATGVAIACLGRRTDAGEAVAAGIRADGGQARFLRTDLTDEAQVRSAIEQTVSEFGRIDVLVSVAAGTDMLRAGLEARVEQTSAEVLERMLLVNLYGPFFLAKYGLPHLRSAGGGALVAISSISAHRMNPAMPAYAASKAALEGLVRQIAADYADDGIRANSIVLGSVSSPETAAVLATSAGAGRGNRMIAEPGSPADVADLVEFLVSPRSRYLTAAAIPLDGGALAAYPAPVRLGSS